MLCELLPVGIPSLAACLQSLVHGMSQPTVLVLLPALSQTGRKEPVAGFPWSLPCCVWTVALHGDEEGSCSWSAHLLKCQLVQDCLYPVLSPRLGSFGKLERTCPTDSESVCKKSMLQVQTRILRGLSRTGCPHCCRSLYPRALTPRWHPGGLKKQLAVTQARAGHCSEQ